MPHKVLLSASKFDKALQKEASKNYRLSIQLSLDGLSFCVLDTRQNKYSAIEVYNFQDISAPLVLNNVLNDLIAANDWLKLTYQETRIIFEYPKSTIIPLPLFYENHAEDYLHFNHYIDFGDKIRFDKLPNLDAVNIFAVPEIILQTLQKSFPGAHIHHFTSPLIENLIILNKNQDEDIVIFAHVRKSWFDLLVLSGKKLIFINSFKYKTKEDFVYFLAFVMEQLNINPEKTCLTLVGDINKISSLFELAFKYVRNVKFGKRTPDYGYSYVFDEFPEHFFFNLLNLQRCEL